MCKTPRGCKIEELAQDKEVTRLSDTYLKLRALLANELYRTLALEQLKSEGLADPGLLLELESRVMKYIKSQKKDSKSNEPQTREMI